MDSKVAQVYHPEGNYILPYLEYQWYNNMNAKQCSWMTTPPKIAAQCNNAMPYHQVIAGTDFISSFDGEVTISKEAQENFSSCLSYSNCAVVEADDDSGGFPNTNNTATPSVSTMTPNDMLNQRIQIQSKINDTHNSLAALWNTVSHDNTKAWQPPGFFQVNPHYNRGLNYCVPNASTGTSLSIPAYSADTDPVSIQMPLANMLYDSTNCGPKTNAQEDWGTTDYTDIFSVMEGAEKKQYLLMRVATGAPATNQTPTPGVKMYPKAYNYPWIESLEYCHQHKTQEKCSDKLCTWNNTNRSCELAASARNLSTYPTPTLQSGENSAESFTDEQRITFTSEPMCLQAWNPTKGITQTESGDNTENTCTGEYNYYDPQNPSPPIVIDNKTVGGYCNTRKTQSACTGSTPKPGVCYSKDVNSMGAPAVYACMATSSDGGNSIPSFNVQLKCMQHNTEADCTGTPGNFDNYTCTWESVQSEDQCKKHSSEQECQTDASCAWGTCMWVPAGGGNGVCQADFTTQTVINPDNDPFVWSMHDNFKKSPRSQLKCNDCSTLTVSTEKGVAWGQPNICPQTYGGARPLVNGTTGLNGIPFCVHYAA